MSGTAQALPMVCDYRRYRQVRSMILNPILQLKLLQPTHCHSRSDIVEALPIVLKSARSTTLSCTRILAGLDLIEQCLIKIRSETRNSHQFGFWLRISVPQSLSENHRGSRRTYVLIVVRHQRQHPCLPLFLKATHEFQNKKTFQDYHSSEKVSLETVQYNRHRYSTRGYFLT